MRKKTLRWLLASGYVLAAACLLGIARYQYLARAMERPRAGRTRRLTDLLRPRGMPRVFDLRRGVDLTIAGVRYAANAQGFRARLSESGAPREYERRRPAGMKRVLVLAGSAGFGVGLDVEETFPALLEGVLNRRHPGAWEVYNLSAPGDNLFMRLQTYLEAGSRYEHDFVVLYATPFALDMPLFVPMPGQADPRADLFATLWNGFNSAMTLDVPARYHRVRGFTNTIRALDAALPVLRRRRARLVLLADPLFWRGGEYFDLDLFRIEREFRRRGAAVVECSSKGRLLDRKFRVPDPAQQRRLADALAVAIERSANE